MYETLRLVTLFEDLADEDLALLCAGSEEIAVSKGSTLFVEGDPGDSAYVITEGEIEILKQSTGREVLLAVRRSPEVIGEMALLEGTPRIATARARTDVKVLTIPKPALDHLVETSATAVRALLHTVIGRLRDTEAQVRQGERMLQLGTLTAGVAHELNNPASGVKRGADLLGEAMAAYGDARQRLASLELDDGARTRVDELLALAHGRNSRPAELDALACSDREAQIEDWLDEHDVEDPWDLAAALMYLEINPPQLDDLLDLVGADALEDVLKAVVAAHEVHVLLHQVEEGSSRISEIVKALKSYSYLDQAPVQEVDVTEGIDDTLLLLGGKTKTLRIVREYADPLPSIEAYGSELNQVWTNLIDNAADALTTAATPEPMIIIRARPAGDSVVVEVEDNGPGIPADIQEQVFDRFFTTKAPGSGTGLGLDTSQRIVMLRHRGNLTLDSEPGRTTFRVELPLHQPT